MKDFSNGGILPVLGLKPMDCGRVVKRFFVGIVPKNVQGAYREAFWNMFMIWMAIFRYWGERWKYIILSLINTYG